MVYRIRPTEPTDLIIEADNEQQALQRYSQAITMIGVECYQLVAVTGEAQKRFKKAGGGIDIVGAGAIPDKVLKDGPIIH